VNGKLGKSIAGWWFFANPSEKYWDDEIPIYIYMTINKIPWFQTTNQIKHVSHIIFKQLLDFTKTNNVNSGLITPPL